MASHQKSSKEIQDTDSEDIERAIKLFIDYFVEAADLEGWGSAYKALYAPHIKVLARLVASQLKYDKYWANLRDVRHAVDKYAKEYQAILRKLPNLDGAVTVSVSKTRIYELIQTLDQVLLGGTVVVKACAEGIDKVNSALEIKRPNNIIELVLGERGVYQGRNDVCDSIRDVIKALEALQDYQNKANRLVGKPPKRLQPNFLREGTCPQTTF